MAVSAFVIISTRARHETRSENMSTTEERHISNAVISRLPRYYRYLGELLTEKVERISSNDLSRRMHVTASQIRQDLNNFGGFGQQGYGYNVKHLYTEIGKILGLDQTYTMIIIGAGNLGHALANYVLFEKRGFKVIAIFDINEDLCGQEVRSIPILNSNKLPEFLKNNQVDIAALTLPSNGARAICPVLVSNGVKAIWNFAHTDLEVPEDVVVKNVHLSESLMELSYMLNRQRRQ